MPSLSTPTAWDVFLSFRGTDTRTGFTTYLYEALSRHGIRTFMDDPELHSGEIISDALLEAIRSSKIYIVVLSQNYASSRWCLDELVEIIRCKRVVIPVFYKIDPSVVRYQTMSFQTAFEKHQIRFGGEVEKLQKWRLTLSQVGDFSGHHVDGTRAEVDIINQIVDAVVRDINPVTLAIAKYSVGIEASVAKITEWLTSGTPRGHYIGIYGMGGVGKTTLVRALFNANLGHFDGGCFLENVTEVCGQSKGPEGLQAQLIGSVLRTKKPEIDSVAQGMELIRKRILWKKILVVVDDANDQKQLESLVAGPFAYGSIIILTTRRKDLLDKVGVEATYQYMLNELDDADSRQLFNKHAFENENPSDTCVALSKEIIHHAGGLPLALEIFGSNLRNQPEAEWRRFIGELKEVVNPDIQRKLVISFESLVSPTLKEMFLDIACFFLGHYREDVVPILGSCYRDVDANIDRLKSRCLIKIDENDKFSVHDLVRDMAWEIARQSSGKDELKKHSRVSGWEDIYSVLNGSKVMEAIKCIILQRDRSYLEYAFHYETFDTETFKRMPNLRFLKIARLNLTGSFEQIFKDLTWLCWSYCPLNSLGSDFCPPKLVILELPDSHITRWNLTKDLTNLKILDLSGSYELITIPEFCRLPCLETINLSGCTKLEKVDTTIGDLKNLVSLDLGECTSLRYLPDSVCKLTTLESLEIGGSRRRYNRYCDSLEALPEDLGNMKSLKRLVVVSQNITKLPDSIIHLTKLVELRLDVEKLETLGVTICYFRSLEILGISGEKIEELVPYGSRQMFPPNLKQLMVTNCRSILRLQDLSGLKYLELLDLSCCSGLIEIEGLEKLICIKELDLGHCTSMIKLPNLSSLKHLESLTLWHCSGLIEIEGLEELVCVKVLYLGGCTSMIRLPNLSNFKCLEILDCGNCSSLMEINGLEELISIRRLDLGGCTSVKRLPDLSNLKQLETLILTDLSGLKEIEGLEELTSIRELDLIGCESLNKLPNLSKLKELERLKLRNCSSVSSIEGLEELTSIIQLDLTGCGSILRLPNLSKVLLFDDLLNLTNCSSLIKIEGLEELTSIRTLNFEGCRSMKRLQNLSKLKQLETLKLRNCSSLREIEGLEELTSIRIIDLRGCDSTAVANTLTEKLFQMYSQFGNRIEIHVDRGDGLNWMSHLGITLQSRMSHLSSTRRSRIKGKFKLLWKRVSTKQTPNSDCTQVEVKINHMSHAFLGLLLTFDCLWDLSERYLHFPCRPHEYNYTIDDVSSDRMSSEGTLIVIVPREHLIELKSSGSCDKEYIFKVRASCGWHEEADVKIGVHPLYKLQHMS